MEHHGSGTVDNNSDGTFSHTILPMGADSTEANGLVVVGQFFSEGSALVDAIVCVVGINSDPNIASMLLKLDLSIDGVRCVEGDLVDGINVVGGSINKESCATELVVWGFLSSSVEQATWDRREGLVAEDEVARSGVSLL